MHCITSSVQDAFFSPSSVLYAAKWCSMQTFSRHFSDSLHESGVLSCRDSRRLAGHDSLLHTNYTFRGVFYELCLLCFTHLALFTAEHRRS